MSIFEKKSWTNRLTEYPKRRRLTEVEGQPNVFDVDREEGTISDEGDAFNSTNMNGLEDRIETAFGIMNTARIGTMIFNGQEDGTVTLIDSVENYDNIEIYYKNNDSDFDCMRVLNPNGKKIVLNTVQKRNRDKKIWFKTTEYTISGNTIYPNTGSMGTIAFIVNTETSLKDLTSNDSNMIEICKVIGYKNNIQEEQINGIN